MACRQTVTEASACLQAMMHAETRRHERFIRLTDRIFAEQGMPVASNPLELQVCSLLLSEACQDGGVSVMAIGFCLVAEVCCHFVALLVVQTSPAYCHDRPLTARVLQGGYTPDQGARQPRQLRGGYTPSRRKASVTWTAQGPHTRSSPAAAQQGLNPLQQLQQLQRNSAGVLQQAASSFFGRFGQGGQRREQ